MIRRTLAAASVLAVVLVLASLIGSWWALLDAWFRALALVVLAIGLLAVVEVVAALAFRRGPS